MRRNRFNIPGPTLVAPQAKCCTRRDLRFVVVAVRDPGRTAQLQADLIAAVQPFTVETGPIGVFTAPHDDPATDAALIQYVATFLPKMSGANFNPHVSTGVAPREYLDKMLAEPFEPFISAGIAKTIAPPQTD